MRATAEHRFLTTAGYCRCRTWKSAPPSSSRRRSSATSSARHAARRCAGSPTAPSARMGSPAVTADARLQAARPHEDKAAHMRRMHELHPDMTRAGTAAMHERVKWLWANDPEWRARQMARSFAQVRAAYDTGRATATARSLQRHVVRELARARDVRVAHRLADRVRDAQVAHQRAHVRLLLRRRVLGDGRHGPCSRVLRSASTAICRTSSSRRRTSGSASSAIWRQHMPRTAIRLAIEPLGYESTYDVEMCADGL